LKEALSALVLLGVAAGLLPAPGVAQPAAGTLIAQAERQSAQGPIASLLGTTERASVIVFFRTGQEHSRATLVMMAECEREMAGRPIHWAAVVSDHDARADVVALIQETGIRSPVLIDKGDELYALLQVKLHPVVLLVDQEHKLHSYQTFRKINYCAEIRAALLRILGDITEEQLQATLHPADSPIGGELSKADREVRMAERRLGIQSWDKAIESAKKALEHDPKRAAAWSVIGRAQAAKGDCAAALEAFKQALALDPKDEAALKGAAECPAK
jgi:tetratricopeptide (TPR) repeat protein